MNKSPRKTNEILKLLKRPDMTLPEILVNTTSIPDINIKILSVGERKDGDREIAAVRLCCDPPESTIIGMDYLRQMIKDKVKNCRKCSAIKAGKSNKGKKRAGNKEKAKPPVLIEVNHKKPLPDWKFKMLLKAWDNNLTRWRDG